MASDGTPTSGGLVDYQPPRIGQGVSRAAGTVRVNPSALASALRATAESLKSAAGLGDRPTSGMRRLAAGLRSFVDLLGRAEAKDASD